MPGWNFADFGITGRLFVLSRPSKMEKKFDLRNWFNSRRVLYLIFPSQNWRNVSQIRASHPESRRRHNSPQAREGLIFQPESEVSPLPPGKESCISAELKRAASASKRRAEVLLTYGGLVNAWLKRGQREVKQWSNTGFVHRLDTLYPKPWIALSLACHWQCFALCLANSEYISLVWPLIIHCSLHCLTTTYPFFIWDKI